MEPAAVKAALAGMPGWKRQGKRLEQEFVFGDFAEALRFVVRVGREAEKACHHPDIDIRWNRVRLSLTTHDEGGLTDRDVVLAARLSVIAVGARPRVRRASRLGTAS